MRTIEDLRDSEQNRAQHVCPTQPHSRLFTKSTDDLEHVARGGRPRDNSKAVAALNRARMLSVFTSLSTE